MNNFFDNKRILTSVWKWKIHIIVVVVITVLLSAIISGPMFITPKFKSTARIYPTNISEASKESESEHLLEYLQSYDIKFRVIDAFKLDEVYDISKEEKLYQTWILYEFDQNVSYKKTEFETIEIKVLDEDPKRACAMVDSIIVFLNDAIYNSKRVQYLENAQIFKNDLNKKQAEIDSVSTLLEEIREKTGLVDYFAQAATATRGLMDAAALGGDINPAKQVISDLVKYGGDMRTMIKIIDDYQIMADTLKRRYDSNISLANQKSSYSRIVEHPFVADKKAYPIRWLIVFMATVAVSIMSVITVSLIDYIREIKSTL